PRWCRTSSPSVVVGQHRPHLVLRLPALTFEVGEELRRLGTGYIRSRLQEAERAAAGVAQHRIAELVVLGLDPDLDHRSGSPTPLARARGHRVVDHSSHSAVLCLAFGRATITSEGQCSHLVEGAELY